MDINYIIIITSDGRDSEFTNVESYSYDRDFIRIHYIEELDNHKAISVFPTSNVIEFNIDFSKGGENNA